ncbi:hypothetical protein LTR85_003547 [Meristemomyces frigidus]|nr:hypothetical protein LTR85_003547 [Meristemomyces frigidus]
MASADRITVPPSSSPQLPSPSTFIRPLKSGSRAQQPPSGAHVGFASAASLWSRDGGAGAAVAAGSRPAARDPAEKRGRKTEKGPRKRKPKSEAIIINSDEPEQSAYFAPPKAAAEPAPSDTLPTSVLDETEKAAPASRRRLSWTPAKNTVAYSLPDERPFTADSAISVPSPTPRVPLSELLGNFGYTNNDSTTSPPPERATTGEATTKRRRIELSEASKVSALPRKSTAKAPKATEMPPPKAAKRSKSPKKKPQTITALATAAYQPLKEPEPEQSTASEFFAPRKEDAHASPTITETAATETVKAKKPRKPRIKKVIEDGTAATVPAKKPARSKKVRVKLNEAAYLAPLYSPEKANAQIQQQAFLFGTSSQLATDESPTFIREMQLAIRESELVAVGSQAAVSPAKKSSAKVPTAPHGTCLSVEQAEKELWCSAARDFKGGLLREKSGLHGRRARKHPGVADSVGKPMGRPPEAATSTDIAETTSRAASKSDAANTTTTATAETMSRASSKSDTVGQPMSAGGHDRSVHVKETSKRKRRADTPKAATEPDSFINIDEISDSDSPPTPSPPRRRASAPPSPVQPLALEITGSPSQQSHVALPATGAALKATDSQWPSVLKQLFPRITAAVKASPRSTDSGKPSWHQKILLYDPIVLEDFTAYLNAQALRISVQRTKRKAPSKGRKKKDAHVETAPEVEMVEEELQAWMVQKWCEEMSVCCLWKNGLRGGVKTAY